jgi:hypothetical protein
MITDRSRRCPQPSGGPFKCELVHRNACDVELGLLKSQARRRRPALILPMDQQAKVEADMADYESDEVAAAEGFAGQGEELAAGGRD